MPTVPSSKYCLPTVSARKMSFMYNPVQFHVHVISPICTCSNILRLNRVYAREHFRGRHPTTVSEHLSTDFLDCGRKGVQLHQHVCLQLLFYAQHIRRLRRLSKHASMAISNNYLHVLYASRSSIYRCRDTSRGLARHSLGNRFNLRVTNVTLLAFHDGIEWQ